MSGYWPSSNARPNPCDTWSLTPSTTDSPDKGFRLPQEISTHAVWLSYHFSLSYRDVEDLLAERGILVTYETVRQWCLKLGQSYANQLRRRRAHRGDTWHLDVRRFTQCLIPVAAGQGSKGRLWVKQLTCIVYLSAAAQQYIARSDSLIFPTCEIYGDRYTRNQQIGYSRLRHQPY